jgi:hypothetical protein
LFFALGLPQWFIDLHRRNLHDQLPGTVGIDLNQAQHKISALRMSGMMSTGALSDRDLALRGALKYFREAGLIR